MEKTIKIVLILFLLNFLLVEFFDINAISLKIMSGIVVLTLFIEFVIKLKNKK